MAGRAVGGWVSCMRRGFTPSMSGSGVLWRLPSGMTRVSHRLPATEAQASALGFTLVDVGVLDRWAVW